MNENQGRGYGTVIIVIAVVIIAFIIINKVFGIFDGAKEIGKNTATALGIMDSEEEKKNAATIDQTVKDASSKTTNPWNPRFYKEMPTGAKLVTNASAVSICKSIWDSVGVFSDNAEQGFAAIKQCPTQAAVSFVCDIFYQQYKKDLLSWLQLKYDTEFQRKTLVNIISFVNGLKKY